MLVCYKLRPLIFVHCEGEEELNNKEEEKGLDRSRDSNSNICNVLWGKLLKLAKRPALIRQVREGSYRGAFFLSFPLSSDLGWGHAVMLEGYFQKGKRRRKEKTEIMSITVDSSINTIPVAHDLFLHSLASSDSVMLPKRCMISLLLLSPGHARYWNSLAASETPSWRVCGSGACTCIIVALFGVVSFRLMILLYLQIIRCAELCPTLLSNVNSGDNTP